MNNRVGMPVVALPLLALFIDVKSAAMLLSMPLILSNLPQALEGGKTGRCLMQLMPVDGLTGVAAVGSSGAAAADCGAGVRPFSSTEVRAPGKTGELAAVSWRAPVAPVGGSCYISIVTTWSLP
jgi:hypothetical protein